MVFLLLDQLEILWQGIVRLLLQEIFRIPSKKRVLASEEEPKLNAAANQQIIRQKVLVHVRGVFPRILYKVK